VDWREAALDEIQKLKLRWSERFRWEPCYVEVKGPPGEGEDEGSIVAIDLYIRLRGRRLGERTYLLRLQYLPDWQVAGRREAFLNPDDPTQEGTSFWPPNGTVRGINPANNPPAICLRGAWGYHSVLHPAERPTGTTLNGLLLELQKVVDE
jgi:hypothetical protein